MTYKNTLLTMLIVLTGVVAPFTASAQDVAIVFGSGYSCLGAKIYTPKGKTQKLSTFKEKINEKLDSAKTSLSNAKKRGQASKITSYSQKVTSFKDLLANGKSCAKGTLLAEPTPAPTPTSSSGGNKPEKPTKGGSPKGPKPR